MKLKPIFSFEEGESIKTYRLDGFGVIVLTNKGCYVAPIAVLKRIAEQEGLTFERTDEDEKTQVESSPVTFGHDPLPSAESQDYFAGMHDVRRRMGFV